MDPKTANVVNLTRLRVASKEVKVAPQAKEENPNLTPKVTPK
jgi:hypothetical protein